MTDEKLELLHHWYKRIRIAQRGHYQDAQRLRRLHFMLGIPVVILTTIVGTGVFASLSEETLSFTLRIILGLISILAASLASLQTFLNHAEQSAQHLKAATQLSSLKKEIEESIVLHSSSSGELDEFIHGVRLKWETITTESPLISESVFNKNFKKYGGENAFPIMLEKENK